jgi:hypothetical protein
VRLRAPLAEVAAVVGPHLASLTAESPTSTILRAGWDNLAAPVAQLAALDMDFEIIEPVEFTSFALRLSRRLKAAAGNVTDAAEDTLPRQ